MENNSSWHSFDDFIRSFNTLSRISKHKLHPFKNTDKLCTNSVEEVGFPNASKVDEPSSLLNEESLPKFDQDLIPRGMGRGKMIQTLEDKFGTEKLDKQIHSELRQLNPCGYSNDAIEENFGFVNKNHSPSDLGKGGLLYESDKMGYFEDNVKNFSGFSEEIQSFSSPNKENENNGCYKNNAHKTEVHEDHKIEKNDILCEENIISTSDAATNESISKKVKKRRCRNFVVLQFSSTENNDSASDPNLKEPNEFLKQSQKQLKTSNEFSFSSSDFPPI